MATTRRRRTYHRDEFTTEQRIVAHLRSREDDPISEAAADLIERQAAEIARLRSIIGDTVWCHACGSVVPLDKPDCDCVLVDAADVQRLRAYNADAIAKIAEQRAEIERLRAGAWRPIDDEARNGKPWIVCNRDGQRSVGEYEGRFGDDTWCTHDGYWLGKDVIAYAPLPPPPSTSAGEG